MPLGLVRYQDTGNPHFITFSCYHRLKFFSSSVTHVDQVGDNSHNSSVPHICPPLADVGKGYQEPSVPHICPPLADLGSRCSTLFLRCLELTRRRYRFDVFGYVVMPEHIHLLVSEPEVDTLATAIQSLKLSVARLAPKAGWRPTSPFWQKRYYDHNVRSQMSFQNKLRYIHRNPVKRELCSDPDDWPWSSFHHYFTAEIDIVEIESEWTAMRRIGRIPHLPKPGRCGAPTWEGWSD